MPTPSSPSALPVARREQLLVVPVADETLVQDLANHQAHCLNPLVASVWEHCDGKTAIRDIAQQVTQEHLTPVDEKMVWLALHELGKIGLLQQRLVRPADQYLSRRDFMRATGALAATALVTSIFVPAAHAQASCGGQGAPCTIASGQPSFSQGTCCTQSPSLICNGTPGGAAGVCQLS
ncbi:MAG: PqqD family protein [Abitibacteriaceae bacterium]|nr:PqqD family protein [Abditibacteriaceae bacterium]